MQPVLSPCYSCTSWAVTSSCLCDCEGLNDLEGSRDVNEDDVQIWPKEMLPGDMAGGQQSSLSLCSGKRPKVQRLHCGLWVCLGAIKPPRTWGLESLLLCSFPEGGRTRPMVHGPWPTVLGPVPLHTLFSLSGLRPWTWPSITLPCIQGQWCANKWLYVWVLLSLFCYIFICNFKFVRCTYY
jgi:hypothetical protein